MLDEFFALGHLEIMETVWALTRGYGVQMMPILQSVEQLEKLYPNLHNTFIGMAGAILSFAPNDLPTAEWISKRGGDTTGFKINYSTGNNLGRGGAPAAQAKIPAAMTALAPPRSKSRSSRLTESSAGRRA